jgi:RNA polymerase sigma-70 factor (family 1)
MLDIGIKDLLNNIALNNDRASFKRLYVFYYGKLFSLAKSFVKFDELAEEITNDVFLNLWIKRAGLTEINNFTFYCYTAIKNKSLTCISKGQANNINIDQLHLDIADTSATGEDKVACADLTKIINHSLGKLSEPCRIVFKLVKEDGLKYREVAELLDISVKTVEYHIGNALKTLSKGIENSQRSMAPSAPDKILKNN